MVPKLAPPELKDWPPKHQCNLKLSQKLLLLETSTSYWYLIQSGKQRIWTQSHSHTHYNLDLTRQACSVLRMQFSTHAMVHGVINVHVQLQTEIPYKWKTA